MTDDMWGLFAKTGLPQAYLLYKRQDARKAGGQIDEHNTKRNNLEGGQL